MVRFTLMGVEYPCWNGRSDTIYEGDIGKPKTDQAQTYQLAWTDTQELSEVWKRDLLLPLYLTRSFFGVLNNKSVWGKGRPEYQNVFLEIAETEVWLHDALAS